MSTEMEDDSNFGKLPAHDRELHLWASTQVRGKAASPGKLPGDLDMLLDCVAQADAIGKDQSHPLGDQPLVDISAGNAPPLPPPAAEQWRTKYTEMHSKLLSLSGNSKEVVAENSGHFIIIVQFPTEFTPQRRRDEIAFAVRDPTRAHQSAKRPNLKPWV